MTSTHDLLPAKIVRKRSWIKILVGFAAVVAMSSFGVGSWLDGYARKASEKIGSDIGAYFMLPLTIPWICLFMGLLELITGKPWLVIDTALQNLKQWQQIVLFVVIFFAATGLVLLAAWCIL